MDRTSVDAVLTRVSGRWPDTVADAKDWHRALARADATVVNDALSSLFARSAAPNLNELVIQAKAVAIRTHRRYEEQISEAQRDSARRHLAITRRVLDGEEPPGQIELTA